MMGNGTINQEYVDNGREPVIKIGKIDLCNYSIKLYGYASDKDKAAPSVT